MTYLAIAGLVVVYIVCQILDGDSKLAKMVLACAVAGIAFLFMYLLTDWDMMATLAKIGGIGAVSLTAIIIVLRIFKDK